MNFPRFLLLGVLLGASAPSFAGLSSAQLEKVVSSLSLSGTIEVDPQGHVVAYAINDAAAYDQAVIDLLGRDIPRWTFKPVVLDGVARQARFDMYLRLEAKPLDGERYAVEIASAAFGRREAAPPHTEVSAHHRLEPPRYPADEARKGVGAKVVLVLRIDRAGHAEAGVEQTDLRAVGKDGAMQKWRDDFERAALLAARHWTFEPPSAGRLADAPYWYARVPVVFSMSRRDSPRTGEWESYVPGPRRPLPWAEKKDIADSGVDALPDGRIFPLEQPLQLLTPLNQG